MKLFHCLSAEVDDIADATSITTPLGIVRLDATFATDTVSSRPASIQYLLEHGGWLVCWHEQEYDLELLVCRPKLPMNVTEGQDIPLSDCWAGMWRLKARTTIGPCLFTAAWENEYTWHDGGPNSGQYLYAKSWDDGVTEVSIGTEDDEALSIRAINGENLPKEWSNYFGTDLRSGNWESGDYYKHDAHEKLRDNGVPTPLPCLEADQFCQISFAVAWANYDKKSATTWLAVDLKASDILKGSDCK